VDTLDDAAISHFIPSVRLTGSREAKLRKLDTLIQHLLQVRDVLAAEGSPHPTVVRSYRFAAESRRAFTVGFAAGALLAAVIQAAIRWLL
jgi:hypothetical protein